MVKFFRGVVSIGDNKFSNLPEELIGQNVSKNKEGFTIKMSLGDFLSWIALLEVHVKKNWNTYPIETRWSIAELAYSLVDNLDEISNVPGKMGKDVRNLIREFADEVFDKVELDDELIDFVQQSPNTST